MADINNITLTNLAAELGQTLKARGFMLALAESCTGGMVAQFLTSIAGSSIWFDRGFVTYSNLSKIEMLNVSNITLENFGAVSEETALEMVHGAIKNSHAQIAGSITGIAGPDGGTIEKPVGTVCFAWSGNKINGSLTMHFTGDREEIRQQAAITIMQLLLEQLKTYAPQ